MHPGYPVTFSLLLLSRSIFLTKKDEFETKKRCPFYIAHIAPVPLYKICR